MRYRLDDDTAAPPAWLASTKALLRAMCRKGSVRPRDHDAAVRLLACLEADDLPMPEVYTAGAFRDLRLRWASGAADLRVSFPRDGDGVRFEMYGPEGLVADWRGGVLGLRSWLCYLYPDLRARWRGEDCGEGRTGP